MTFKPLLAVALKTPFFPCLASPKLDGIRSVIKDSKALSRSLKLIPNKHIQSIIGCDVLDGLDGELIVGSPTDPNCFRNTTTVVMSHDKVADFTFHVFDDFTEPNHHFGNRLVSATNRVNHITETLQDWGLTQLTLKILPHKLITNQQEFDEAEMEYLTMGYEGMMVRGLTGHYKFGRATEREQILSKVKRFVDSEAIVIGFEELMHNDNEKSTNELGRSKRSSHQDGKRPAGTLGALIVKDVITGIEFNIGTGFDAKQRDDIWDFRESVIGKMLTYKYFPIGIKEKPRHSVFKFWRTKGF